MANDEKRDRGGSERGPGRNRGPARRMRLDDPRQAAKFVWGDGDVVIMPAPKRTPEKESPRPHESEDRPGSGRG
jgi:hypothetical protein